MTHEPALSPLRHIPGALGNTNLDNHQWTKEILWISRSPVEKFHNIFRGKTFQLKQLNRIRGIVISASIELDNRGKMCTVP